MTTKYTYALQFPVTSDNSVGAVTAEEFWTALRIYLHSIPKEEIGQATTLLESQALPDGVATPVEFATVAYVDAQNAAQGGPFLPTSGGTVTGPLTVSGPNAVTLTGAADGSPATITTTGPQGDLLIAPALQGGFEQRGWKQFPSASNEPQLARWNYTVTGTLPGGQQNAVEWHSVNTDTVDGGFSYFNFAGGPQDGSVGGRLALGANLQQTGNTVCPPGEFYVGAAFWGTGNGNAGGIPGNSRGSMFGTNDVAQLKPGATNWQDVIGCEINVSAEAGCSVNYKVGLSVIFFAADAVAGSQGKDYAFGISASGPCSGWDVGYAFGSPYGTWAMKPTGTMIGTIAGIGGGAAWDAAWGIDFSAVTFSGGLIRGPGFTVNGTGGISFSGSAASSTDLSRHIDLAGGNTGFCTSFGTIDYNVGPACVHNFLVNGAFAFQVAAGGVAFGVLPVNAVNDAAAETAGVIVGGVYRNGSALMVRAA